MDCRFCWSNDCESDCHKAREYAMNQYRQRSNTNYSRTTNAATFLYVIPRDRSQPCRAVTISPAYQGERLLSRDVMATLLMGYYRRGGLRNVSRPMYNER